MIGGRLRASLSSDGNNPRMNLISRRKIEIGLLPQGGNEQKKEFSFIPKI